MHELSVAQRIVEIALDTAVTNGGGRIAALRIRLGALTCIDADTLRFAIDIITRETPANGCRLEFVRVPCRLLCSACGNEAERDLLEPCPACTAPGGEVLTGRELLLESIEIEDDSEKAKSRAQAPGTASANQESS